MTADPLTVKAEGVAVALGGEGRVTEVLCDGLGVAGHVRTGDDFASLFDGSCARKAEAFLAELRRRGAVFDWELVARDGRGRLVTLHFAGAAGAGGLLAIGARSRSGVARVYEGMVGINNEQANALRAALKDLSLRTRERSERDAEFFEELTRLNNELASAQRELAKKNFELARLNEQKNRWLGIAAHDLRNPLEVVLVYSRFLLEDLSDKLDAEHVEFVNKIERSSRFMLGLVNDLLDVSKIEAGRLDLDLDDADLAELTGRCAQLNGVLAERKGIRIHYAPPDGPVAARVDAAKIEQVLNNLLGNAVKFSPRGSLVTVGLGAEGRVARVWVEDEGPGVPPGELDEIFRPFGRTSARGTGGEKNTGLGLAISRRIVEGHGGAIEAGAGGRGGARFVVTLPLAPGGRRKRD